MKDIIEKILEEVDLSIREAMMADSTMVKEYDKGGPVYYRAWEMFPDPAMTILKWQELRNIRNTNDRLK